MCGQIVDLRQLNKEEETKDLPKNPPIEDLSSVSPELGEALLEWSAYEHARRKGRPHWFLIPGGIALALVVFGIFTQSYFFSAFIGLAFIVLLLFRQKEAEAISFIITSKGFLINNKFYGFKEMKSFWIFDRPNLKELSFETTRLLSPFIRVPLGKMDTKEVKSILETVLPEKEHQEFLTDRLTDLLGI